MAQQPGKPIDLQKPPGYRDPNNGLSGQGRPPLPPPKRPLSSFQPRKKRRSCCRICCCNFCAVIFILSLLILISVAILYIWFNPKPPVIHLQSFSFPHFNITMKSDGTYLDAKTITRVEIRNPNEKLEYYYGALNVEVNVGYNNDVSLGSARVPGFTQAKKNVTNLKIETISNEFVEDGMGPKLASRYKNKELVVNVGVLTSVGIGVQGLKTWPLGVNVFCGGVRLKDLDQMPKCTVNFLKWINIH